MARSDIVTRWFSRRAPVPPAPAAMPPFRSRRAAPPFPRRLRAAAAGGALLLAAACGAPEPERAGPSPETPESGIALPEEALHVHGLEVDSATGEVLVATHTGLFVLPDPEGGAEAAPEHVGPVVDLMGFAAAEPDRLLASGHPGPDLDMPDPVGLIESRDGGATWEPLSLAGESDFHALAVAGERVVGFDGRLRATEDGDTWELLNEEIQPFSLAVADDGETVLATTQHGPARSTDGGASFEPVQQAPPLALVDWVAGSDSVYGVAVDGEVHRSDDAGTTWAPTGRVEGEPEALHADAEQVLVAAGHRVSRSTDGGETFGW